MFGMLQVLSKINATCDWKYVFEMCVGALTETSVCYRRTNMNG